MFKASFYVFMKPSKARQEVRRKLDVLLKAANMQDNIFIWVFQPRLKINNEAATESKISLKKPPLVKIMAQLETLKTPKIQCWFLFFLSNKLHLGGFLPTYKRMCAWIYQIHKFSAHLCCRFQTARGQTSLTCTCSTKSLFLTVKCC